MFSSSLKPLLCPSPKYSLNRNCVFPHFSGRYVGFLVSSNLILVFQSVFSVSAEVSKLACLGAPKGQERKYILGLHNNCLYVYNHKTPIPNMMQIFLPVSSAWGSNPPLRCRTLHCHLDSEVLDKVEGPSSISGPGVWLAVSGVAKHLL